VVNEVKWEIPDECYGIFQYSLAMIWIRLLLVTIASFWKGKIDIATMLGKPFRVYFRVWFNEADLANLSGSRYLAFMEVARFDLMLRTGCVSECRRNGWLSSVVAVKVSHKRPIKRFQKFSVQTSISYHNKSTVYLEQLFFDCEERLLAVGHVRVCFLQRKKGSLVPLAELFSPLQLQSAPLEKPEFISKWEEQERLERRSLKQR